MNRSPAADWEGGVADEDKIGIEIWGAGKRECEKECWVQGKKENKDSEAKKGKCSHFGENAQRLKGILSRFTDLGLGFGHGN